MVCLNLWFRRTRLEMLLLFLCVFSNTKKAKAGSHGSAQPFRSQRHSHSKLLSHVSVRLYKNAELEGVAATPQHLLYVLCDRYVK